MASQSGSLKKTFGGWGEAGRFDAKEFWNTLTRVNASPFADPADNAARHGVTRLLLPRLACRIGLGPCSRLRRLFSLQDKQTPEF